jgi:hypothetical protein
LKKWSTRVFAAAPRIKILTAEHCHADACNDLRQFSLYITCNGNVTHNLTIAAESQ